MQILTATLEDEVDELPDERIAWSTYWQLCWRKYPGAVAYELETVTSEGTSPKLRRQRGSCFRIEAAHGENSSDEGLANREVLLASARAQLAYRVRAVLDDGIVSGWSRPLSVGEEI